MGEKMCFKTRFKSVIGEGRPHMGRETIPEQQLRKPSLPLIFNHDLWTERSNCLDDMSVLGAGCEVRRGEMWYLF